jgi:hypothetical protein
MCQLFVRHPVETQLVDSNGWFYRYNGRSKVIDERGYRAQQICNVAVSGLL